MTTAMFAHSPAPDPAASAVRRKSEWSSMPSEFFTCITFGDLKVGDFFIALPTPGDNSGHGGFRGGSYVFQKVQPTDEVDNNTRSMDRDLYSHSPDSMPVYMVIFNPALAHKFQDDLPHVDQMP